MDDIFSSRAAQMEDALAEVAALAADSGMPEVTSGPILTSVAKRARMINMRWTKRRKQMTPPSGDKEAISHVVIDAQLKDVGLNLTDGQSVRLSIK